MKRTSVNQSYAKFIEIERASVNLNLATVPNLAHLVSANSKRTSWLYGKENSWIGFSDDIA